MIIHLCQNQFIIKEFAFHTSIVNKKSKKTKHKFLSGKEELNLRNFNCHFSHPTNPKLNKFLKNC
jgi:hypothetical protein